jgi:hypothetical protein
MEEILRDTILILKNFLPQIAEGIEIIETK